MQELGFSQRSLHAPVQPLKRPSRERKTDIPEDRPDALTKAITDDATKVQQWNAFVQDVAIDPGPLADVVTTLATFLMPHAEAARKLKDN